MKILSILGILVIAICAGGFLYIAFSDVKVEQKDVVKVIDNARFAKNQ